MATKLEIILELQNRLSGELKTVRGDLDRLSTSAKKTNTSIKSFDKSMTTAGKAATGLRNILLPLVGITLFVSAIKKIADFEQAMAGVRAVITPTEEEFQSLNDEARRLGATTVFSATEAARGLEFLGRAGFSANEAVSALEGTLNLAAAGGLGLAEAADIASNVLSGFNLEASEAGRVSDVLAATAASANTNVSQLGEAIKLVAPIAAAMSVPVETAAAAIGKLSDAGLQGSIAGTGLRRVLATLNTPSKKLTTTMAKLGLETKDVAVSGDNLAEVMGLLGTAGLSATDALQLFGDRGAPAALAMANVSDELKILNDELLESEGRAKEMAEVMSDTLVGSFKQLNSAIEETLLQTGDSGLLGDLRTLIDTMAGVVRTLNGTQDPLSENAILYRKIADGVESFVYFLGILIASKAISFAVGLAAGLGKAAIALRAATVAAAGFRLGLVALGRAALLAIGPVGWIIGIGLALASFYEKDAPKTVEALANIADELDTVKFAAEGLSNVEIQFEIAGAQRNLQTLTNDLNELKDLQSRGVRTYEGEDIQDRIDALQQEVSAAQQINDAYIAIYRERIEAEVAAKKEAVKRLAKLEGEAQQAAVSAAQAATNAKGKILEQELAFAKKVAKDKEAIGTEDLKQQLKKDEITIEEYYFRVGLLAEERQQADLDLLDAKVAAVRASKQAELDILAEEKAVESAGTTDAELAALNTKFANKTAAINTNFQVELNQLELNRKALALAAAASDAKLETQELTALDKRQNGLEVKQKEAFERRFQAIQDEQIKLAEAAQRDVDSGVTNQFELAGKLAEIDDTAIAKYTKLREEAQLFNQTVQDPDNAVAITAITDAVEDAASRINPELEKIKANLTTGLAQAFESLADGSKSAEEAFEDFARSFLRYILQMITQAIALQAIKLAFGASSGGSFSEGGSVGSASKGGYFKAATGGYIEGANTGKAGYRQGFAEGGFITGKGTKTSDSIPAALSTGEYVIKAAAVDHYGLNFIEAVNRLKIPAAGGLPKFSITRPRRARFATGGSVEGASNTAATPTTDVKLRVINNVDPDLVEGFMNSREGEETIMNLISNNSDKIKGILQ